MENHKKEILNLTKWEKRFILKYIRKRRRFSFKFQSTAWGILSSIFAIFIPISILFEKLEYLNIILFMWLLSFSLCSINSICNVMKKYDDKLPQNFGNRFDIDK